VISRLKRAAAPSDHQGMFLSRVLVLLMAIATVGSAGALWAKPPTKPQSTTTTQTTSSDPPTHTKAYGRYCQNQSKQHVPGQKGTPFSQCVTAMAKAAHGQSPVAACAALSKKHVAGEQGTPFSRCVAGAAQLKRDQHTQHS
jgi:hypothetical protein